MIRTKRITSISDKCIAPSGYEAVNVLSWKLENDFHTLSPYHLKTDGKEEQLNRGKVLFENFWQGSKVYPLVHSQKIYSHRAHVGNPAQLWWQYDTIHPGGDVCIEDGQITDEYRRWRDSLWKCKKPIRYPNGYHQRRDCLFSLLETKNGQEKLNYIDARKRIYLQEYTRLIRKLPEYDKLLEMLKNNKKLCIFEIDVPVENKKGLYGKNLNKDGSYTVSLKRLDALINDPSESFGHGLCLAYSLLTDMEVYKNQVSLDRLSIEN